MWVVSWQIMPWIRSSSGRQPSRRRRPARYPMMKVFVDKSIGTGNSGHLIARSASGLAVGPMAGGGLDGMSVPSLELYSLSPLVQRRQLQ